VAPAGAGRCLVTAATPALGADWPVAAILARTPISTTCRVTGPDGTPAVLRVDGPGARALGLDRAREPPLIARAAAAGLGPPLLGADPAAGRLLTGWVPGQALTAAQLAAPGVLARAARLLRHLHGTGAAGPPIPLEAAITRYGDLAGPGTRAGERVRTARARLAAARDLSEGAPVFCHGDPTPGNFIAGPGGRLTLIDWEYAGLADPYFDLAGLATGPGDHLLTAYLGRAPRAPERARLAAWLAFAVELTALWTAAVANLPGGESGP